MAKRRRPRAVSLAFAPFPAGSQAYHDFVPLRKGTAVSSSPIHVEMEHFRAAKPERKQVRTGIPADVE